MADNTTGWIAQFIPGHANLEAENRELRDKLAAMTVDRNLWQDAHNDDCPNAIALTAANTRIAELEAVNALLLQERGCLPGAGSVLSGIIAERNDWKMQVERLEANAAQAAENCLGLNNVWERRVTELVEQVRELQWKPLSDLPEEYRIPLIMEFIGPNPHTSGAIFLSSMGGKGEGCTRGYWELNYTHYRPINPPDFTPPSPSRTPDGQEKP